MLFLCITFADSANRATCVCLSSYSKAAVYLDAVMLSHLETAVKGKKERPVWKKLTYCT